MLHGRFRGDGRTGYNRGGQAHIPLQAMGQGAQGIKLESLPHSMSHLLGTETRRGSQWEFLLRTDGPAPSALGGGGSGLHRTARQASPPVPCGVCPPSPRPVQALGDPQRRAQGRDASVYVSEEMFLLFWENRTTLVSSRGRDPTPATPWLPARPRKHPLVLSVCAKAGHPLGSRECSRTLPSPPEWVQDSHALSRGTQVTRELSKVANHEDNGQQEGHS